MPTYDVIVKTGRLVQITCTTELTPDYAVLLIQELLIQANGIYWLVFAEGRPVKYETPEKWQFEKQVAIIDQYGKRSLFKFVQQGTEPRSGD